MEGKLSRAIVTESGRRTVLKCPYCEVEQDILAFKNLSIVQKYAHRLNAVVKCVLCRHVFSPKDEEIA